MGYIAMVTKPQNIDQQITEIMTMINRTIPQENYIYINETTSALNSKAILLNYKPKYCVGDSLIVQVDMFNYLGKRKTYGGDLLRARIFSPELGAGASGRIEDFNNGTYNIYFTLFWEGKVQISIILMHPSEGVALLWKGKNIGFNYISYTGKYLTENKEVHTECGLYLNSQQEKCTYMDRKYREVFYCIKLPAIPCEALISLKSVNTHYTFLTNMNKALFSKSNIAIEIPKQVGSIDVSKCSEISMNVTSKCQIGTFPPFPSGYFLRNQWFPSYCNLSSFEPLLNIHKCLAGKMIYLMGDSTIRQWIEFFPKVLKSLQFYDIHRTGWHKTFMAFDLQNNIFIQWKKHGHPFVTMSFFNVKDHAYIPNELDRLAGGSNTIIVISIGQHFRPFPFPLFIKRLLNIRQAIESLFLRSPYTKVIIKSENTRETNPDVERFSDFYGYIQYLLVKDIFQGLNVGMIDAWDMSTAFGSRDVHPPEPVVKTMMITTRNQSFFLVVTFISILLISLALHHYTKSSGAVLYSSKPTVNHMEEFVTVASLSSEDEIQASLIFKNISVLIPSIKFSHKDNATSAKKSRATILNPRKKYCVGETIIVQIEMFDHLGNRKTYGGDFIRARMFSPNLKAAASGRIDDFSNGTYHVYFTLFWEGKVFFSLVLYHPSEAVSALWRARNWAYGLIYFTGTFTNGTHQEKSECGFQLSEKKAICEYRNEEYNELFYCAKPESFHCGSLIYLQSFNRDVSFLSPLEKSLFNRENIAVEIQKDFESIDVYLCTESSPAPLEQCKIGMVPPFPSGFVVQNKWKPVFCHLANFTLHEQMFTCLKDKMIYLMGDSTVRQWYLYLANTFKGLKNFDLHRTGLESMLLSVDLQSNIKLQWKKHSHPIVASRFYSVKDDRYVSEQIDHLDGGPHYVMVICLGQHFRAFPIHLFIQRVINVRKALERLFIRSPDTKVIIKSENTREMSIDPERFSDFHGYIQYLIVKDIFRDLHVAVIDAWDMTIAYNTNNVHPPDNVIQDQIYMFLTYIC
ncbi:NXPE family member 1-like [Mantella aurantiaca]